MFLHLGFFNVIPVFPIHNIGDGGDMNVKLLCKEGQVSASIPCIATVIGANVGNLLIGKPCSCLPLPARRAIFEMSVSSIFLCCSAPQMGRITATAHIAFVKDMQPIWNPFIENKKGRAMRRNSSISSPKFPISVCSNRSHPKPAFIRSPAVHLTPKAGDVFISELHNEKLRGSASSRATLRGSPSNSKVFAVLAQPGRRKAYASATETQQP